MTNTRLAKFIAAAILFFPHLAFAEGLAPVVQENPVMRENKDGDIKPGEYQRISENGGLTRRPCPYSCEMKGIPRKNCKEWVSRRDTNLCYVEDTRLPSDAVRP